MSCTVSASPASSLREERKTESATSAIPSQLIPTNTHTNTGTQKKRYGLYHSYRKQNCLKTNKPKINSKIKKIKKSTKRKKDGNKVGWSSYSSLGSSSHSHSPALLSSPLLSLTHAHTHTRLPLPLTHTHR